ncbi:MAG: metalloregulator ArsR/SmtB family transcription factor [Geobacteraceae bacterium]|nr:metalloregulator ArsR/SmtB family transcription factor [Geobacteraceae bacterium]
MKTTSRLFKALADETRLRILSLLMEGELCVCNLMEVLRLPQSTVSRHLAYLKNAGWVDDRREGVWMYYSINRKGSDFHDGMFHFLKRHLASLPVSAADRKSLAAFEENNKCA